MSLKSAGYDAVVLLNERFLNQASGALFYNGFLKIAQDVDLIDMISPEARAKIDPSLYHFLKMHIRLHLLHEPSIDFLASTSGTVPFSMRILTDLRIIITLWDGLELPFTARMSLVTACSLVKIPEADTVTGNDTILDPLGENIKPSSDLLDYLEPGSQMLLMDFTNSEVETFKISWNNTPLQSLSIDLDKLIMTVIRAEFIESNVQFALSLPSFGLYIPDMERKLENRFYGNIAECRVLDNDTLAVAVNFNGYEGGVASQLTNFAKNCTAGIAVPEKAMHKVIDFAWDKIFGNRRFSGQKVFEFVGVDKVTQEIGRIIDLGTRILAEIATFGFVEPHTIFHGLDFIVDYSAEFPYKPDINFLYGNKVRFTNAITRGYITLRVVLDVETWTDIDVTGWFPDFIPDIEGTHYREKITIFNARMDLHEVGLREATGKIVFNDKTNTLAISLESLDLALDVAFSLFPGCPILEFNKDIQEGIANCIEDIVIAFFPTISVLPPVNFAIPVVPWKLNIKGRKLDIQAGELVATLDSWFDELQKNIKNVPKYIVNTNNNEIHYLGCSSLLDTYENHQEGFHLLNDAVNQGYDGCGRCIPEYHTK